MPVKEAELQNLKVSPDKNDLKVADLIENSKSLSESNHEKELTKT